MSVHKLSDYGQRRHLGEEAAAILGQTEELALDRLLMTIAKLLEQLAEMLFSRAEQAVKRDETNLYLAARSVVQRERQKITEEFERILRQRINTEISGEGRRKRSEEKNQQLDRDTLSLVDPLQVELNVAIKNLSQGLESACHDELSALNQRIGYLLGDEQLELSENPLSPEAICEAFKEAWTRIDADPDIKLAVLKQVNQGLLTDINSLYSDLNRHLVDRDVLPQLRPTVRRNPNPATKTSPSRSTIDTPTPAEESPTSAVPQSNRQSAIQQDGDIYATLQNLLLRSQLMRAQRVLHPGSAGQSTGQAGMAPATEGSGFAVFSEGGGSGGVGAFGDGRGGHIGTRLSSAGVVSALTRLQHGETSFVLDNGSKLELGSIDQAHPNVLREIKESTLGTVLGQEENLTIELVAMLFDFIFEDPNLSDAIKALLGRLQIPVLKAAMLNREFFSKKTHPARLLVNKLAEAGMAWSPVLGHEDPLYKKIAEIVHKIQSDFADRVELFSELHVDLEKFLAEEERNAAKNIENSAAQIERDDKTEVAKMVAHAEVENCINYAKPDEVPAFLSGFLRARWVHVMHKVYVEQGEKSNVWANVLRTMAELVWSIQPKRSSEERQHLVSLLPDLLRRLKAHLQEIDWSADERSQFLEDLIAAHASAVKIPASAMTTDPSMVQAPSNWRAKMATLFTRSGVEGETLAKESMHQVSLPGGLSRGKWVEFTLDDGSRVSYKFSWISPFRGILLFTNRSGLKAFSLTREEMVDKFRLDRARIVDEEPLVDRALTKILEKLNQVVSLEAPAQ